MKFPAPLIIAHRGASASAPENTLAAFQKAIADGADGIECDVQLSKDGVPVVIHDTDLKRLANIEKSVADLTAEELCATDVGSWFNQAFPERAAAVFARQKIPTLAALLESLADYKGLIYIELKDVAAMPALVENVCRLLDQKTFNSNVVVKSFNLEAVRAVKNHLPNVRTAALFEPKLLTVLRKNKSIIEAARNCRADEISTHYSLATRKLTRSARENNLSSAIWTANRPLWVRYAFQIGINAIITNEPARLSAVRDRILKDKTLKIC